MERTIKIIRRSIYTFFQNYHYFTSTATFLLFPVSASILLSQTFESSFSSLLLIIESMVRSPFEATGFYPSSNLFLFLIHKLSQTIFYSIFTLPFTLTFLLVAKAAIIQALHHKIPHFSSLLSLYKLLLLTQLCNTFLVFAANATGLCILILTFNFLYTFGFSSPNFLFFSAAGAVLYSVILTNTVSVCNLALVVAGIENSGGFLAILKACFLIKGRASTALSLALPVNLGFIILEALFRYRVVKAYNFSNKLSSSAAFEGLLIAYLYSLLILMDTVMSCIFYKSCNTGFPIDGENNDTFTNLRSLHELP